MCAINPTHKKRFIIDVYTANPHIDKETFESAVISKLLDTEQTLNERTPFRFHIKETKQKAD